MAKLCFYFLSKFQNLNFCHLNCATLRSWQSKQIIPLWSFLLTNYYHLLSNIPFSPKFDPTYPKNRRKKMLHSLLEQLQRPICLLLGAPQAASHSINWPEGRSSRWGDSTAMAIERKKETINLKGDFIWCPCMPTVGCQQPISNWGQPGPNSWTNK